MISLFILIVFCTRVILKNPPPETREQKQGGTPIPSRERHGLFPSGIRTSVVATTHFAEPSPISAERSKAPIKIKAACDVREPSDVVIEPILFRDIVIEPILLRAMSSLNRFFFCSKALGPSTVDRGYGPRH